MQRLILFLIRNQYRLVFFVLLIFSVSLVINQHYYHSYRFISSKNLISGKVLEMSTGFYSYLGLKQRNESLVRENRILRETLFNLEKQQEMQLAPLPDTLKLYNVLSAYVIKNSFNKARNYITIDKGSIDGVVRDMAVINSKGVVGIVEDTSLHFSTVQSILNERTMINAKIKGKNSFGTITWNAEDFDVVQLGDIPTFIPIKIKDTVVTAGMSHIFPKNIPIGFVQEINAVGNYYTLSVKLFGNMANLGYVYILENTRKNEVTNLEFKTEHGN